MLTRRFGYDANAFQSDSGTLLASHLPEVESLHPAGHLSLRGAGERVLQLSDRLDVTIYETWLTTRRVDWYQSYKHHIFYQHSRK